VLLIATGIIIVVGMAIGITMVPKIQAQYVVGGVAIVPYIFMPAGAGVVGIGGYMVAVSQIRRRRRTHITSRDLDDLR
jgi:hypothetical protein